MIHCLLSSDTAKIAILSPFSDSKHRPALYVETIKSATEHSVIHSFSLHLQQLDRELLLVSPFLPPHDHT